MGPIRGGELLSRLEKMVEKSYFARRETKFISLQEDLVAQSDFGGATL